MWVVACKYLDVFEELDKQLLNVFNFREFFQFVGSRVIYALAVYLDFSAKLNEGALLYEPGQQVWSVILLREDLHNF